VARLAAAEQASVGEGTVAVIAPGDVAVGMPTVTPRAAKGLEYDAVIIVEPQRILATEPSGAADLYVALTRATQRLGVVHSEPLPEPLRTLRPVGGDRP
jgi:hypothetical protein